MKILVTSGTGKVGRELCNRILERGHEPVIMTHSLDHLKLLPDGIEGIFADFEKPESWKEALKGIQKVCLITPLIKDEAKFGRKFAEYACRSGIDHVVLLSIHKAETGTHIPHFFAKLEMEEVIKESGIPYTFIRANNFYQNDRIYLGGVEAQGMYTQPLGKVGLNRVDVRDVADAMANALFDALHYFKTYNLVGPETLSGKRVAEIYSKIVDNRITYPENCLEIWETNFQRGQSHWQFEDLKMMYEFFLAEGLVATSDDLKSTLAILEKRPRRFEDYAKELLGKASAEFEVKPSQFEFEKPDFGEKSQQI